MKFLKRITCLLVLLSYSFILMAQGKQVVIFSTNDMHARIHNFAKIAAYIENYKKQNPNVLVLSGGDLYSGNPVVDQYPEKGYPMIDLMNRTGYQFSVFGNHEFDYGQATTQRRIDQANFKFLCSNLKVDETCDLKQPDAYAFIKVGGIKIGIVGILEATVHGNGVRYPACHPARVQGITFTDPVEEIQNYRNLRKKCNLFIALSHAGYESDLVIADKMPELDAIVGGHSHTKIDSTLFRNGVLVTQASSYTEGLGKLTFTFKGKKLIKKEYEYINVKNLTEEDATIAQAAQEFIDKSPLKTVLAEAAEQLDGKEELGGLMCDALVSEYGVDFAVQNSGGIRISQLKKGPITMEDVYTLDPFGNTVTIYNMSYTQLATLLKNSYRKYSQRADLMCSGLKYKIYTKDGEATRVEITDEQGNPVDQNRTFKVAMNNYISSSYSFDQSGLVEETANSASDALIAYLKKVKSVKKDIHRTEIVRE